MSLSTEFIITLQLTDCIVFYFWKLFNNWYWVQYIYSLKQVKDADDLEKVII